MNLLHLHSPAARSMKAASSIVVNMLTNVGFIF
jgi:hypothetical protein